MTEILKNTLQEVTDVALAKWNKIKTILEDYFGEDKVEFFIPIYYNKKDEETPSPFIIDFLSYLNIYIEDYDDEETFIKDIRSSFLDLDEASQQEDLKLFRENRGDSSQDAEVTIYFPEITITNENGNSTKIKKLFARFNIKINGSLASGFRLLRSHYTYAHFKNDYMHSHVNHIPISDPTQFQSCCTGRGPINETMNKLRYQSFNEAQWMQFCWDLDKYVQVESLSGIPYHKLLDADCEAGSNVLFENYYYSSELFKYDTKCLLKDFLKYIIESNKIRFRYSNNGWNIAHSFSEFTCIISKLFLQWLKESAGYLFENYNSLIERQLRNWLICVIYKPNGLYIADTNTNNLDEIDSFRGSEIVTFKGTTFYGEVDEPLNQEIKLRVLKSYTVKNIRTTLLKILNENYGRKSTEVLSEGQ